MAFYIPTDVIAKMEQMVSTKMKDAIPQMCANLTGKLRGLGVYDGDVFHFTWRMSFESQTIRELAAKMGYTDLGPATDADIKPTELLGVTSAKEVRDRLCALLPPIPKDKKQVLKIPLKFEGDSVQISREYYEEIRQLLRLD